MMGRRVRKKVLDVIVVSSLDASVGHDVEMHLIVWPGLGLFDLLP